MSFFRKLKDRMFKSSSRLEEGLDAIVEEGADAETDAAPMPDPAVEPTRPPATAPAEPASAGRDASTRPPPPG
jgi:fused signal recognition particle receptor